MNESELTKSTAEFMGAFELVFHHDWDYSIIMMGDQEEGGTFLKPGLDDEENDLGGARALAGKISSASPVDEGKGDRAGFAFELG